MQQINELSVIKPALQVEQGKNRLFLWNADWVNQSETHQLNKDSQRVSK